MPTEHSTSSLEQLLNKDLHTSSQFSKRACQPSTNKGLRVNLLFLIDGQFMRELITVAITFHPKPGLLLLADFSQGFKEPEMVKSHRPVVVLSPQLKGRSGLVTVVALSTVEPPTLLSHHYKIPKASMPMLGRFQDKDTWVKGDMVYTLGFHRLDCIKLGTRNKQTGKREYYTRRFGREQMKEIYSCVLNGLNLGHLPAHL